MVIGRLLIGHAVSIDHISMHHPYACKVLLVQNHFIITWMLDTVLVPAESLYINLSIEVTRFCFHLVIGICIVIVRKAAHFKGKFCNKTTNK